jgi:hypothetical protein
MAESQEQDMTLEERIKETVSDNTAVQSRSLFQQSQSPDFNQEVRGEDGKLIAKNFERFINNPIPAVFKDPDMCIELVEAYPRVLDEMIEMLVPHLGFPNLHIPPETAKSVRTWLVEHYRATILGENDISKELLVVKSQKDHRALLDLQYIINNPRDNTEAVLATALLRYNVRVLCDAKGDLDFDKSMHCGLYGHIRVRKHGPKKHQKSLIAEESISFHWWCVK